MKNLKLILAISALAVMISSCKKDESPSPSSGGGSTTSCTTTCQNGGTVNSNCGCDCPTGYTGTNCQTKTPVYTSVNVNPSTAYHQLAPQWYWGDDDFGGYLTIEWNTQLFMTNNNTKIYAKVFADFREYPTTGNTAAWIDPSLSSNQILLYTAPAGKKIYSINCSYTNGNTLYPGGNFHGTNTFINTGSNSYFNKIDVIGDTSGPDLPYDGSTERSRFRIYFKSFNITLTNI